MTTVQVMAFVLPLLAIEGGAADTCLKCTASGGSWQVGRCQTANLGSCPVADATCCRDQACCALQGCRAPDQQICDRADGCSNKGHGPGDCSSCCSDSPDGCWVKEWKGNLRTKATPWYNKHSLKGGHTCAEAFPDKECLPCASCDARSEASLIRLIAPGGCVCEGTHQTDSCFLTPRSCSCYCSTLARGLEKCPHLKERLLDRNGKLSEASRGVTHQAPAIVQV